MAIEDVEGHAAKDGVAQGDHLLEQIAGSCFAAGLVPGAPFVDDEFDGVIGILFGQSLPVIVDHGFDALAFVEEFVPVDGIELEGVTFSFEPILRAAAAEIPGVVMQGKAVDGTNLRFAFADEFFEEAARPTCIVAVGSRGDQRQRAAIVNREPCGVTAKFYGVFLRGEVAATSPGFVADSPESYVEWIGETCGGASVR